MNNQKLIQIALLGKTPIIVEEGLIKAMPIKLFILHTENEVNYSFESKAEELKEKIKNEYRIDVKLVKVQAFDMDQIIKTILNIILKEIKSAPTLTKKKSFLIDIRQYALKEYDLSLWGSEEEKEEGEVKVLTTITIPYSSNIYLI